MYVFVNILMLLLVIAIIVMALFNGLSYYGGCGWGDKGGCVKCHRAANYCLFTGWPMCTIILCCIAAFTVLLYVRPPAPPKGPKYFAKAELQKFYANNGMDKIGLKIKKKKEEKK